MIGNYLRMDCGLEKCEYLASDDKHIVNFIGTKDLKWNNCVFKNVKFWEIFYGRFIRHVVVQISMDF